MRRPAMDSKSDNGGDAMRMLKTLGFVLVVILAGAVLIVSLLFDRMEHALDIFFNGRDV